MSLSAIFIEFTDISSIYVLDAPPLPPPHTERPTQYQEEDVFVVDSRYNETEKKVIKLKGLKV